LYQGVIRSLRISLAPEPKEGFVSFNERREDGVGVADQLRIRDEKSGVNTIEQDEEEVVLSSARYTLTSSLPNASTR